MQSWEDIKTELGRKANEAIAEHLARLDDGAITEREMRLVVDAIYDTIMGLAPMDVSNTIYEMRGELKL